VHVLVEPDPILPPLRARKPDPETLQNAKGTNAPKHDVHSLLLRIPRQLQRVFAPRKLGETRQTHKFHQKREKRPKFILVISKPRKILQKPQKLELFPGQPLLLDPGVPGGLSVHPAARFYQVFFSASPGKDAETGDNAVAVPDSKRGEFRDDFHGLEHSGDSVCDCGADLYHFL
jgi:hypothetical protein